MDNETNELTGLTIDETGIDFDPTAEPPTEAEMDAMWEALGEVR